MDMKADAASPATASAVNLEGFVPNKALGQNFLADANAVRAILDAADVGGQAVLEIGPGSGALTEGLLERAGSVAAIEKDGRLCGYLAARFGERLTLVHADFLTADVASLTGGRPWHAVGNLPYYATTPIVLRLLALLPESMTLMVQAEAAERFFSRPRGRVYGPVAVATQCFYSIKTVMDVPRSSFSPQPNVDSTVVRLTRNGTRAENPAAFLAFVQAAFSQRRKTLFNALQRDSRLPAALQALNILPDARAEALPPETLLRLYRLLESGGA